MNIGNKEVVGLSYPVTLNGETYKKLSCRRPTVGDQLALERLKKTDAEKEVMLVANLSEVPCEVIHALDISDYRKLQKIIEGFTQ